MSNNITPVHRILGRVKREATIRARTIEIGPGLTTADIGDFDTSNATDGALLLYDGTISKFRATPTLNNQNTTILGGGF